jgi:RNA-binding protein YhbY
MSLILITDAMKMMESRGTVLSREDQEFVFQFAFQTGDKELTGKLIEELDEKDADHEAVKLKYLQVKDKKPAWVENIENLLVALEMYRIEEGKAIGRITEILRMNGVTVTEDTVKNTGIGELRTIVSDVVTEMVQEKAAVL